MPNIIKFKNGCCIDLEKFIDYAPPDLIRVGNMTLHVSEAMNNLGRSCGKATFLIEGLVARLVVHQSLKSKFTFQKRLNRRRFIHHKRRVRHA